MPSKSKTGAMEPGSDVKARLLGYFAKYTKHYRELYKSQGKQGQNGQEQKYPKGTGKSMKKEANQ